MSRSSTHDFYLGRGPRAEWIGSIYLDSCACNGLGEIEQDCTADEFADLVSLFLHAAETDEAGEVTHRGREWPWPWPASHGTDYTHAFDLGAVWTAPRGDRWSVRGRVRRTRAGGLPSGVSARADTCGYTGVDAADTLSRRYGPLQGETHRHDLHQLGLQILVDLTLPLGPGAPAELAELRERLSPHLRYAVTANEAAVELEWEVFGYRDGDPAAETTAQALTALPALYGWTDPDGGPPRFGMRILVAAADDHTSHPALTDRHVRAVLASY